MNLSSILLKAAGENSSGITFIQNSHARERISYRELYDKALLVLGGLQLAGCKPGDEVVIQVEDNKTLLYLFWGCILGKILPVPISAGTQSVHKDKLLKVWTCLSNPYLIEETGQWPTNGSLKEETPSQDVFSEIGRKRIPIVQVLQSTDEGHPEIAGQTDLAYIQFSSGSTGQPKGVCLTHSNLICNINDIIKSLSISKADILLSWMPLTHDMGMIGFHLTALLQNIDAVIIPTALFIRRPLFWMDMASSHKASVLYSPNFGLQYFLSAFDSTVHYAWNLSCIRVIVNGAEQISHSTCLAFTSVLGEYGLRDRVILTAYGLAEASVEVTAMPFDSEVIVHYIDRAYLNTGDTVRLLDKDDPAAVGFVDVGYPVDSCVVRICNDDGLPLTENAIGHIQISGSNVTRGYYRDHEATLQVFAENGWLKTGDLGFIGDGRLTVTGRYKDVIIINGRNYFPHDIENVLIEAGISEPGKIAAGGINNPITGSEELIIFVLHKGSFQSFLPIIERVRDCILRDIGLYPELTIPVKKIQKTTSGKIRRYSMKEQYIGGAFDEFTSFLESCRRASDQALSDSSSPMDEMKARIGILLEDIGLRGGGDFLEMGMNSITAMLLAGRIEDLTGIAVPVQILFRYKTPDELVRYLSAAHSRHKYPDITESKKLPGSDLSLAQQRIWMEYLVNRNSSAYNIPVIYRIRGKLKKENLDSSFRVLIGKYEILRTSFSLRDDRSVQEVHEYDESLFLMKFSDLRYVGERRKEPDKIIEEEINKPFKLEMPSQFRLHLIQLDTEDFILIFVIHHILADGWSLSVLMEELCHLYNHSFSAQSILSEKTSPIQYGKYIEWQSALLKSDIFEESRRYWLKELKDLPDPIALFSEERPADRSVSIRLGQYRRILSVENFELLKELARKKETTVFSVLMTLVNILIYRYTNKKDIILGFDVAGRVTRRMEQLIGYTLNTLCLRIPLTGDSSFEELADCVKEKIFSALEYQCYPFEMLLKEKEINRRAYGNALFSVLVLYQNFHRKDFKLNMIGCDLYEDHAHARDGFIDTVLEFTENGNTIEIVVGYNELTCNPLAVERFVDHLCELSGAIVANPSANISLFNFLTASERKFLFTSAEAEFDKKHIKLPVHQMFERKAAMYPDAIAVEAGHSVLTYSELNRQANRMANFLKAEGVKPDDRVGFLVGRNENIVVSILAILKSNACFVAIDPEYPIRRCEQIVSDAGLKCLLTDNASYLTINDHFDPGFLVVIENECFDGYPDQNPVFSATMDHLAYVIYTSGSTGQPKGVMITHGTLYNYVRQFINYFDITRDDVFMQQSSVAFDTIMEEIFPALWMAAKIIIAPGGGKDIPELIALIAVRKITVLSTTPLVLNEINKQVDSRLATLRIVISGGDVLRPSYISNLLCNFPVYNTYGPAETTVCAAYKKIDRPEDAALIGKAIANYFIYILDENRQLMPLGRTGDLYISGGLARGYLNMPDVTEKKFIANPFAGNGKMYFTGDTGRYTGNGDIEFTGRSDLQVKVRGHRVETEEIAAMISSFPTVEIVVVTGTEASDYLVAYLKVKEGFSEDKLRFYLSEYLPSYMIPYRFIRVDSIPLTITGKIDFVWLKTDAGRYAGDLTRLPKVLPQTKMEKMLTDIWEELLDLPDIGSEDNFFECGGNSIKANQLQNRIYKELSIEVKMSEIFIYPTVRQLAQLIEGVERKMFRYVDIV